MANNVRNFKTIPTKVEAINWDGNNKEEVTKFIDQFGEISGDDYVDLCGEDGLMAVCVGKWIVKYGDGKYNSFTPEEFNSMFEES